MKTSPHFEYSVLKNHTEANHTEWIEAVLRNPVATEVQNDGRIKHWGYIAEVQRYMRVVTLEDRETVLTAFFDRNFGRRARRGTS